MLGAIEGSIVDYVYERQNIKSRVSFLFGKLLFMDGQLNFF